jgi:hypothetical protein
VKRRLSEFGLIDMTISAVTITEKQLEGHAKDLLRSIGLSHIDSEVQLGSYRLDAIALDESTGRIVVVELKTCAHIRSLGQLLLYRSALKSVLDECKVKREVDALLITTFLDREVVDVVRQIGLAEAIRVKVCVGDCAPFSLVDPSEAPKQAWYQKGTLSPGLAERIVKWGLS